MRELLVPLVVYPVVVPLLIAGVKLTGLAFGQGLAEDPADWLTMMVGFDLIFAGLAPWGFARVMVE